MVTESQPKDGLQLLAQDHRKVEDLFARYEKASGAPAKQKIVQQICTELKIHTMIEEEIYYPAIRGKVEDEALDEAWVEHDSAKTLVNELEAAEPDESFYDAKVSVLKELIEHHVKEEEKQADNLFQQTRAADIDREALGEQLAARKAELARAQGKKPAAKTTGVSYELFIITAVLLGASLTTGCTTSADKRAAAMTANNLSIDQELARIEEEYFYPAVRAKKTEEMVLEAQLGLATKGKYAGWLAIPYLDGQGRWRSTRYRTLPPRAGQSAGRSSLFPRRRPSPACAPTRSAGCC